MATEKDQEQQQKEITKTKSKTKTKVTFEENLAKIRDTSQPVSISALYALSAMTPERQAQFEEVWRGFDNPRRLKVAAALTDLSEEVVELDFSSVYSFLLHDQEAEVRGRAIEGLWEDEGRPVLAELLKMLESDPSPQVREKAAIGAGRFAYLAELGRLTPRWIDKLRETLLFQATQVKNPVEVERRVIEGLGYFHNNEQVVKLIEKTYQSDNELLKAGAVRAMGRNVNTRWLPEIGKEMSSPNPLLRFEAATACGEMSSAELLPAMVKLTQDKDLEVRQAAIWAFGQIGGSAATRILKDLLTDENNLVREAAQEALKELAFIQKPLNPLGEL